MFFAIEKFFTRPTRQLQMLGIAVLLGSVALSNARAAEPDFSQKAASAATVAAQERMRQSLPADDGRDEKFATRGFVATLEDPIIRADDGSLVWDTTRYDWVKGDAPETVNPSLWRHIQILRTHGLFEIAKNVWQVRGLDASNMLVVKGDRGWVIIDPLFSKETAAAALGLVTKHLGKRPVTAVVYTHSHGDHFGGVRALADPNAMPAIISPERLIEETVAEFLLAGNTMGRRASYQFGTSLERNEKGRVGGGIVIDPAGGEITLLEPSDYIHKTGETRTIDGVRMNFQMVPETEAPSEMNVYLPEHRVLYVSEIVSCTMHNLQTPRGALVRDGLGWAGYLTEAMDSFGDAEALTSGHCWPRFSNAEVMKHLRLQRDAYKFIHDQTMRLMNKGATPTEIADELQLPKEVAEEWSARGYYGTVRHNAKGVYQRYIGWWDGNPAHFNLHPPVEQGKRYVRAMGGADGVMKEATRAMDEGDYRWAAEILSHVVFAEHENALAKAQLADCFEQMGYQVESAIWRNIYLSGARELRGAPIARFPQSSPDMFRVTPTASLLDILATRIDPAKIGDTRMSIALTLTDTGETALLSLQNAVLVNQMGKSLDDPTVRLKLDRPALMAFFLQKTPLDQMAGKGFELEGDREALLRLQGALEMPLHDYPLVTP